jgi:phospholipase C
MNQDELKAKVDTIVILMMENRSFDHLYGSLSLPSFGNRTDVMGLTSLLDISYANSLPSDQPAYPFIATDGPFLADLPHNRGAVHDQLAFSDTGAPTMSGFASAYLKAAPTSGLIRPAPMGILPPAAAPMSAFLAEHYTLCDQWFAAIPTSTFPNRLMAMCGDTVSDETVSTIVKDQKTIYHYLTELGVRWRVYHQGLPFLILMPGVWQFLSETKYFRRLSSLAEDAQNESDDTWPQVIFIEPEYYDSPIRLSAQPCDNHPPLPMAYGEAFLRQAYLALSRSRHWPKTVMIYTYDEHGGFFDHVAPLKVPQGAPAGQYPPFQTTGPRVPAVIVSPMAGARARHDRLDSTSILYLLAERFGDPSNPLTPSVTSRQLAGISSVSAVLDATLARTSVPDPPAIPAPDKSMEPTAEPLPSPLRELFGHAAEGLAGTVGWLEDRFPEISGWHRRRLG